ncbi:MAG: SRPBCC family protein [Flavobacterium sp.]|uniref:SRPBCC family protein n=1 Tax=Flavobacterium sp. TaxID=239 RepID=UPI002603B962|nr:SRPBCC family protein [Flavobacterium sp.]MDD5152111.1 SRPBCC family protein [Flavobacterium sp.]
MKTKIKFGQMLLIALVAFTGVNAQKKVQHFSVEKTINLPAEQVWAVVADDYGTIADSHPKIVKSEFLNGATKGDEGVERNCYFNENGTKVLHERMTNYDAANMTFTNLLVDAKKFPINPEYTTAVYKVTKIGSHQCKISIAMSYRTKPAMMGAMAKGSFIKLMKDYFIAIEHHIKTGENINSYNFKKFKNDYSNEATVIKS